MKPRRRSEDRDRLIGPLTPEHAALTRAEIYARLQATTSKIDTAYHLFARARSRTAPPSTTVPEAYAERAWLWEALMRSNADGGRRAGTMSVNDRIAKLAGLFKTAAESDVLNVPVIDEFTARRLEICALAAEGAQLVDCLRCNGTGTHHASRGRARLCGPCGATGQVEPDYQALQRLAGIDV